MDVVFRCGAQQRFTGMIALGAVCMAFQLFQSTYQFPTLRNIAFFTVNMKNNGNRFLRGIAAAVMDMGASLRQSAA